MRTVIALTVLFIAQAAAKIGFGVCPEITPYTYTQYSTDYPAPYTPSSVYAHKLVYGDKALEDGLALAKGLVAQLPNFKCGDLFPAAIFYPDQATFD